MLLFVNLKGNSWGKPFNQIYSQELVNLKEKTFNVSYENSLLFTKNWIKICSSLHVKLLCYKMFFHKENNNKK